MIIVEETVIQPRVFVQLNLDNTNQLLHGKYPFKKKKRKMGNISKWNLISKNENNYKLSKVHRKDAILHVTVIGLFYIKQGQTRASSGPITLPLARVSSNLDIFKLKLFLIACHKNVRPKPKKVIFFCGFLKKSAFLVKFESENKFYGSFPVQKCILWYTCTSW